MPTLIHELALDLATIEAQRGFSLERKLGNHDLFTIGHQIGNVIAIDDRLHTLTI